MTTTVAELTSWESTDLNQLADDRVQYGSLINAETNFRVTYKMKVIFCCQVELLLASQEEELCSMELAEHAKLMAAEK
jgi:hypothetical protein